LRFPDSSEAGWMTAKMVWCKPRENGTFDILSKTLIKKITREY